jgi:RNA polymerase sigma-70 factor (ECF subfamily)
MGSRSRRITPGQDGAQPQVQRCTWNMPRTPPRCQGAGNGSGHRSGAAAGRPRSATSPRRARPSRPHPVVRCPVDRSLARMTRSTPTSSDTMEERNPTSAEMADVSLARIRAGEPGAFQRLVEETWDDLVDHLTWVLGSREAAEDAGQEALIRIWERRERWHDGSARALVFRIARNLAFDARRRERVRREWADREAVVAKAGVEPDALAETSEYEQRFREALEALTPGRREAIELVRLKGLTHQEAAEAIGISQQTVANRMTLALADLRVLLADVLPQLHIGTEPARGRETEDG